MKVNLSEELLEKISSEIYENLKKHLDGADEIDYKIRGISATIITEYYLEVEEEKGE